MRAPSIALQWTAELMHACTVAASLHAFRQCYSFRLKLDRHSRRGGGGRRRYRQPREGKKRNSLRRRDFERGKELLTLSPIPSFGRDCCDAGICYDDA